MNVIGDIIKIWAMVHHLERYGEVKDIETYCKYAQVVNYDQYRSFMEGRASHVGLVHGHPDLENAESLDFTCADRCMIGGSM
jgi:hypothetical protein